VMVVEDDREVADYLVDHLEDAGLTTFAFVTGEESVLHAERMSQRGAALDLVLVDIGLPGIDGLELCRRLKAESATRGLPLVAMSANAMRDDIHRAREAGFALYLTKPIDVPQLLSELDRLLAGAAAATAPAPLS
jgi:CheY-like chemotaxis protein